MLRRQLFSSAAAIGATLRSGSLLCAQSVVTGISGCPADTVARDEDFWFSVRHVFTVDRNMINLNNGGVSPAPKQSCGIGFISIEGMDDPKLAAYLWQKHRIWTVGLVTPGEYQGLRITPKVYTTIEETDTFTDAMSKIIKRGSIPTA